MNRNFLLKLALWLASIILPVALQSQENRTSKGFDESAQKLGIADADLIDRLMPTIEGAGGTAREMLQQQSVKPYMMPVRKVGAKGSDLSYALATCLEYYVNLDENYKLNLSPDFISLNIENTGRPMTLSEAVQFLAQEGTVNAAIVPYGATELTGAVYSTQKYKISNYLYLFREVTPARQRVYEARKALMRGNPVLIELKSDESIKTFTNTRNLNPPDGGQLYPLIVVGYDETQQAFEVMSCWGRNWGTDGYAWMSYDAFGRYAMNGYVMISE
ncbi:MAG: C1 family peptidase [Saprospiraceae bacterium]|nr:C1 family peptidase [Saprospiraceae bacterium]